MVISAATEVCSGQEHGSADHGREWTVAGKQHLLLGCQLAKVNLHRVKSFCYQGFPWVTVQMIAAWTMKVKASCLLWELCMSMPDLALFGPLHLTFFATLEGTHGRCYPGLLKVQSMIIWLWDQVKFCLCCSTGVLRESKCAVGLKLQDSICGANQPGTGQKRHRGRGCPWRREVSRLESNH